MWILLSTLACRAPVPNELARPNTLALGPDGTLYVSDFGHDRIVAFDDHGQVSRMFGESGIGRDQLWRVYSMVVDEDGSLLVADRRPVSGATREGTTWEVKRFVEGKQVGQRRFDGHFTSEAHTMNSIALASDEHLLVANPGGGELFLVDRDGRFVGSFGGVLHASASPHALVRDGDEYWVVDQSQHGMYRVGPTGAEPFFLDDDGHGPLAFPSAAAVCPGQWLAVADLGNHRVQRYSLEGEWLGGFEPERAGPDQPVQLMGIAVDPSCERLFIADSKGNRVLVTTPSGEVLDVYDRW